MAHIAWDVLHPAVNLHINNNIKYEIESFTIIYIVENHNPNFCYTKITRGVFQHPKHLVVPLTGANLRADQNRTDELQLSETQWLLLSWNGFWANKSLKLDGLVLISSIQLS